jgi:hypothetical protein
LRADGEQADVEVARAQRLGRRLLDLELAEAAPADRDDANVRMFSCPRPTRYSSVTRPTAPGGADDADAHVRIDHRRSVRTPPENGSKTLNRLTRRPAGSVSATYDSSSPDATPSVTRKSQFARKSSRYIERRPASARPERHFVGVLEVSADREPAREPCHAHLVAKPVGEVRGRRLPRHRRVRGEHDLRDAVRGDTREQAVDPEVGRLDPVERREGAAEDVVEPSVLARALHRHDVDRLLDHADDGPVATCVLADVAELGLGQVPALAAEPNPRLHLVDRSRQREGVLGLRREDVEASRWAVRRPIPGSFVSCVTRFSTDGLSTPEP